MSTTFIGQQSCHEARKYEGFNQAIQHLLKGTYYKLEHSIQELGSSPQQLWLPMAILNGVSRTMMEVRLVLAPCSFQKMLHSSFSSFLFRHALIQRQVSIMIITTWSICSTERSYKQGHSIDQHSQHSKLQNKLPWVLLAHCSSVQTSSPIPKPKGQKIQKDPCLTASVYSISLIRLLPPDICPV